MDPLLAAIHAAIMNDDPLQLAHLCQEEVDLDERFSLEINEQHVGMTPLALACALNKVKLAEVSMPMMVRKKHQKLLEYGFIFSINYFHRHANRILLVTANLSIMYF